MEPIPSGSYYGPVGGFAGPDGNLRGLSQATPAHSQGAALTMAMSRGIRGPTFASVYVGGGDSSGGGEAPVPSNGGCPSCPKDGPCPDRWQWLAITLAVAGVGMLAYAGYQR